MSFFQEQGKGILQGEKGGQLFVDDDAVFNCNVSANGFLAAGLIGDLGSAERPFGNCFVETILNKESRMVLNDRAIRLICGGKECVTFSGEETKTKKLVASEMKCGDLTIVSNKLVSKEAVEIEKLKIKSLQLDNIALLPPENDFFSALRLPSGYGKKNDVMRSDGHGNLVWAALPVQRQLADLADVAAHSEKEGQVLAFEAGKWVNTNALIEIKREIKEIKKNLGLK